MDRDQSSAMAASRMIGSIMGQEAARSNKVMYSFHWLWVNVFIWKQENPVKN